MNKLKSLLYNKKIYNNNLKKILINFSNYNISLNLKKTYSNLINKNILNKQELINLLEFKVLKENSIILYYLDCLAYNNNYEDVILKYGDKHCKKYLHDKDLLL